MSRSLKITLWVIVAIVVIGGIWWYVSWQQTAQAPAPTSSNTQQQGAVGGNVPGPAGLSAGNSNTALTQDLSSLDAQLNGLASDSASVDQGLNDQPIQQGQ